MKCRLHDYLRNVCTARMTTTLRHHDADARAVHRPSSLVTVIASPKQRSIECSVRTSSIGPTATTSPLRSSRACEVVGGSSSRLWLTCTVVGGSWRARQRRERKDERLATGQVHAGARLVQQQQRMLDEQRAGKKDPLALALGARAERLIRESGAAERGEDPPAPHAIGLVGRRPPRRQHAAPPGQARSRARSPSGGSRSATAWLTTPMRDAERPEVDRAEPGPEHGHRPGGRLALRAEQAQQRRLARRRSARARPSALRSGSRPTPDRQACAPQGSATAARSSIAAKSVSDMDSLVGTRPARAGPSPPGRTRRPGGAARPEPAPRATSTQIARSVRTTTAAGERGQRDARRPSR